MRDVAPGFDLGRIALPIMLRHPLIARRELAGTAGTRGAPALRRAQRPLTDRWSRCHRVATG
ncbi:hypothetical protein JNW89_27280, partial [Micromonospora sp. 4G55]|nr:hypothetical protein [Micromonospora sp. 4G55]